MRSGAPPRSGRLLSSVDWRMMELCERCRSCFGVPGDVCCSRAVRAGRQEKTSGSGLSRGHPGDLNPMGLTICMATPHTLMGRANAAHLWIFINWALGLRAVGYRVFWLEDVGPLTTAPPRSDIERLLALADLRDRLRPVDLADDVSVVALEDDGPVPLSIDGASDLAGALEADLLINFIYAAPATFVRRFRRSALIDVDPGLLQTWMSLGQISVAAHDRYFTIGETVGTDAARFPDCGVSWRYTAPPVFLPAWPAVPADASAPYTTVTGWWDRWMELDGETFSDEKRTAFLRYLDLPYRVSHELELAIILDELTFSTDRVLLERHGWKVRDARDVCLTPQLFREYVQHSRGEFTCARPSAGRLSSTWVSDRTVCYLASGKPVVVEYTAPSRYMPEAGFLRFTTPTEATSALEAVERDYERHSRLARAVAEEHFDATKVARRVLEHALE